MRAFLFGSFSVGDTIIYKLIQDSLKIDSEHLGKTVDFSRIKAERENLIIILNKSLFDIDLDKIVGYINKDKSLPLLVLRKFKTFGAVTFENNLVIKDILVNKIYTFAGIFYLPEGYIKSTMVQTLKSIDKNKLRTYII